MPQSQARSKRYGTGIRLGRHSRRNESTGFASPALTDWKPAVLSTGVRIYHNHRRTCESAVTEVIKRLVGRAAGLIANPLTTLIFYYVLLVTSVRPFSTLLEPT